MSAGMLDEKIVIYKYVEVWDASTRTYDEVEDKVNSPWAQVTYLDAVEVQKDNVVLHTHDVEFRIYYDKNIKAKEHFVKFDGGDYKIEGVKPVNRQWTILKCNRVL